ncbi:4,5-dihydroxyphthalate dehydrogenase [Clostridia bacterium]|nr:4,5-dihydroxyphthalate dehydrogenase [Clostridia bacterium]
MRRFVLAGAGHRAYEMFALNLYEKYRDTIVLSGIFDLSRTRAEYFIKNADPRSVFYDDFDKMIKAEKPEGVIVAVPDALHDKYVVKALEYGCDVVCEKPMTTSAEKCARILQAEKKSGKKVTVTFNLRFVPVLMKLKELVSGGAVGAPLTVHYEYLLDNPHGADYFRRWHRKAENSGGMLVHKSTHHFDLVNWLLDDAPRSVAARARQSLYGQKYDSGKRCLTCPEKKECRFYFDITTQDRIRNLYLDAEKDNGYVRDGCVFAKEADIYDNMAVCAEYHKGAVLTYSLTMFNPYEAHRFSLTGTDGRIEMTERYNVDSEITVFHNDGRTTVYKIPKDTGTHGGGDRRLIEMVFGGHKADPLKSMASSADGIRSVMTGVMANKSIAENRIVFASEYPELL